MRRRASLPIALVALAALAGTTAPTDAGAASEPAVIKLSAAPMFGADASSGNGWSELVARVENVGSVPAKGVLDLSISQGFGGEEQVATRASFAVPPGRSAIVLLPLHSFSPWYAPQAILGATSDSGARLASTTIPIDNTVAPLLVEVAEPARLTVAMRGWPAPASWSPTPGAASTPVAIATGAPQIDRTTGDPVLPDRAAGYAPATAVFVRSDRLVALDEARRDALVDWVGAGGTLAIAVARPEDLRAPVVETLIGGTARRGPTPARLLTLPAYEKPDAAALEEQESPPAGKPAPKRRPVRMGPLPPLETTLVGYEGGALAPSDFGASASYGLGEVHLLAFDPSAPEALPDPWSQTRVAALVGRAWDRRSRVALPLGGGERASSRVEPLRRALDPNENFRLGLGISTVLLVLYACVVGPAVFARASKRANPLLPLTWVPIWSGVAFLAIVAVGSGLKGWRGKVRHLTLLEVGAGATRASVRGYRGFFASETGSLTVAPRDATSLLSTGSNDTMMRTGPGLLTLNADGATLGDVTSLPWQTVVVREDGVSDVGGGVALTVDGGSLTITNHSGHRLKDCVVRAPRGDGAYFATLDDGQSVTLDRGRALSLPTSSLYGSHAHSLEIEAIASSLGGRESERMNAAWSPLEAAAGGMVDWWPDGTPVLLAEVVDPAYASKRDAGLAVDSEHTMLRVVGETSR